MSIRTAGAMCGSRRTRWTMFAAAPLMLAVAGTASAGRCEPQASNAIGSFDEAAAFAFAATLIKYNGELIAGGGTLSRDFQQEFILHRWEPSSSTWQPLSSGVNQQVRAFAEFDGNLIVAGMFTEIEEPVAM